MSIAGQTPSPDVNAAGLLDSAPDPSRYDWPEVIGPDEVWEVPGIVARWLPDGIRVLDVGCGSGAITALVSRSKNNTMLGVEPDAHRSQSARARGLDVVTGVMDERFLQEYGPFDVILFTDVLEHLVAPAKILSLATKGLNPGGLIIASVPNVAHWTVRLKLLFGRFDYTDSGIMDATHLRWFTRKSSRTLFERQGLRVLDTSASAGFWLGAYGRLPFGLLPRSARRPLVQALSRALPSLFGCQHLIKAQYKPA